MINENESQYQPDDAYILETLLFNDAIVTEDVETFELGAFLPPNKEEIF
jgi:ATP-dependent DNA helicase RecQ